MFRQFELMWPPTSVMGQKSNCQEDRQDGVRVYECGWSFRGGQMGIVKSEEIEGERQV